MCSFLKFFEILLKTELKLLSVDSWNCEDGSDILVLADGTLYSLCECFSEIDQDEMYPEFLFYEMQGIFKKGRVQVRMGLRNLED